MNKLNQNFRHFSSSEREWGGGGGTGDGEWLDWRGGGITAAPAPQYWFETGAAVIATLQPPRCRNIRTGAVSVEIVSAVNNRRGGSISGKIANVSVKKLEGAVWKILPHEHYCSGRHKYRPDYLHSDIPIQFVYKQITGAGVPYGFP